MKPLSPNNLIRGLAKYILIPLICVVISSSSALASTGLNIYLDQQYTTQLRQGLINGPNNYNGRTPELDRAVKYIEALKFSSWRMSGIANYGYGGDIYRFVVTDYQYQKRFDTTIVLNIQDAFNKKYGKPVSLGNCKPWRKDCFTSFEALRQAWNNSAEAFLKDTLWAEVDYLDLMGEPDLNVFKGVSAEQVYQLMKDNYFLAKKFRPQTKIVAPSLGNFNLKHFQFLVPLLISDNIKLDAISWHELGNDPDTLKQHIEQMQSLFQGNPEICQPSCPKIHINEYQGEDTMFLPGHAAGWLAQLEMTGIAEANRACWGGDPGSPIPYESCWEGFSGLLMPDSSGPHPVYWVYKYYADLGRQRYKVKSNLSKISAIAGPDESSQIVILAGNYGEVQVDVPITIHAIFASISRIELFRIPSAGNQIQPMPNSPAPTIIDDFTIVNDRLLFTVPQCAAGDAFRIAIIPLSK